jgi:predicted RNA-binding Zn-ribbon protein involved in translation (DUF1610 family)
METNNAVIFNCPECNNEVYAPVPGSASNAYHEGSVPKMIADYLLGSTLYCPNCGDRFTVWLDTHAATVPLFLRKA